MSNTANVNFTVTYNSTERIWKFTFATSPDPLNKWINNDGFTIEAQNITLNQVLITDETTTNYQGFTVDYTKCTSPSGVGIGMFTWMDNVVALFA